jgi:hypothetical protein
MTNIKPEESILEPAALTQAGLSKRIVLGLNTMLFDDKDD